MTAPADRERPFFAWLNRVFSYETMDGDGLCPTYLHRWTLLKVGSLFSIYLHKFVGDDWSLDLHDHPKRFWSIGLWGTYVETSPRVLTHTNGHWTPYIEPACRCAFCWPPEITRRYSAPWFRTFPADHIQRLSGPTPERPCWTLVIVGRAIRRWGFWHNGSFRPWQEYVSSVDAVERRSCP